MISEFEKEAQCELMKKLRAETRKAETEAESAELILKFQRDMIAKERNPLATN